MNDIRVGNLHRRMLSEVFRTDRNGRTAFSLLMHVDDCYEAQVAMLLTMVNYLEQKARERDEDVENAVENASYRDIRDASVYAYTYLKIESIAHELERTGLEPMLEAVEDVLSL